MSEGDKIPYLPWGNFKSGDPKFPDKLKFRALETEPTESELTVNVKVLFEKDGEDTTMYLPLASKASTNK